jgi:hypothetical protein
MSGKSFTYKIQKQSIHPILLYNFELDFIHVIEKYQRFFAFKARNDNY